RRLVGLLFLLHGRILPQIQRERKAFAAWSAAARTSPDGSDPARRSTASRHLADPTFSSAWTALVLGYSWASSIRSRKNSSGGGVLIRPSTAMLKARVRGSGSSFARAMSGPRYSPSRARNSA